MIVVFSAHLEARDPERNRWRCRVETGCDLLGDWLVEESFSRIGVRGRTLRYIAGDELGARRLARACLRRRASAPQRIGIGYQTRGLIDPNG